MEACKDTAVRKLNSPLCQLSKNVCNFHNYSSVTYINVKTCSLYILTATCSDSHIENSKNH